MSRPASGASPSFASAGQRQSFRLLLQSSFLRFIRAEAASGIVLIVSTVLALGLANSPLREWFASLWSQAIELRAHRFSLALSLR